MKMLDNSFKEGAAITPSDSTEFDPPYVGFSFASITTMRVVTAGGSTIDFASGDLSGGEIHRIAIKQVRSTGSSGVTNLIGYRE